MNKLILAAVVISLTACGNDFPNKERDACFDAQKYLWTTGIEDNRYKGNERYWDAISACKDQFPTER